MNCADNAGVYWEQTGLALFDTPATALAGSPEGVPRLVFEV